MNHAPNPDAQYSRRRPHCYQPVPLRRLHRCPHVRPPKVRVPLLRRHHPLPRPLLALRRHPLPHRRSLILRLLTLAWRPVRHFAFCIFHFAFCIVFPFHLIPQNPPSPRHRVLPPINPPIPNHVAHRPHRPTQHRRRLLH